MFTSDDDDEEMATDAGPQPANPMDAVVPGISTTTIGIGPAAQDAASVPTMPSPADDQQYQACRAYLQALHGLGMVPQGVTTPPGRTVGVGFCFRLSWPLLALAALSIPGDGQGASPLDRPLLAIHTLAAGARNRGCNAGVGLLHAALMENCTLNPTFHCRSDSPVQREALAASRDGQDRDAEPGRQWCRHVPRPCRRTYSRPHAGRVYLSAGAARRADRPHRRGEDLLRGGPAACD